MAKYLVTGGCGFIGSHLVETLLSLGHTVRVLDDLSSGKKENVPPEAEVIVGSITDKSSVKKSLDGVEGCFHLAAVVSVEKTIRQWACSHFVNQFGTVHLLDTLVEMGLKIPFVYASSAAVYGSPLSLPINELAPLRPISPYGIDKAACESHASCAWNLHQIPVVGLRFFNVYGTKQNTTASYAGVISHFIHQIRSKQTLTIYGNGEQTRDFIHVSDVVRFLIGAMRQHSSEASIYNICTGSGVSIATLAELIEKLSQKKVKKTYAPSRLGDIVHSFGDPSKAHACFGIKAETSLSSGLYPLIEEVARAGMN